MILFVIEDVYEIKKNLILIHTNLKNHVFCKKTFMNFGKNVNTCPKQMLKYV